MDPMRHLLIVLVAIGLMGVVSGCGSCVHGKCDCVDGHGQPVIAPVDSGGLEYNH
jgi:hypothetical protein